MKISLSFSGPLFTPPDSVSGWTRVVALAWLTLLLPAGAAESRALRFSGSAQYVEVPSGESIVVDDRGPRFVTAPSGGWTAAGATNSFGGSFMRASSPGATAQWTPQLPRPGTYKVYAWWGGSSDILDSAAQYLVKHAAGLSTNVVNQNLNAGSWTLLGTYNFRANNEEYVTVRPSGAGTTMADAVSFVNEEAFNLSKSLTVEAWVNVAASERSVQYILTKGDSWGINCLNNFAAFSTRDASGVVHDLISSQPLVTNRWYHLAATFDGVKKVLYVNGAVAGSAIWQASLATNEHPVWFGGSAETPSTNYFSGRLENVRIWSVVRSQADLQTFTNRNLRGNEAGLLGDWRFDDDGGDGATSDSAAGALDPWLRDATSPPTQVPGLSFGPPLPGALALRFNGFDQSVSLPAVSDSRFDIANAGTIEAWVYFNFPPNSRAGLISKGVTRGWELALDPNGKVVFRTDGLTGPDPANSANQVPLPELVSKTWLEPGSWHHLAAVWNGAAHRKEIYVNGLLDATATNLQGQVTSSAHPVHFAARPDGAGTQGYFEGVLDEVRFWSVARESGALYENFGRDLNGTEPGLAGFWKFDEGSGPVASDRSPYAVKADGTLSGGMSDLNRLTGRAVSAALLLQYCMALNGQDEYIQVDPAASFNLTNLTIEAWVKPVGTNFKTVLRKGDYGYGLAIDEGGYLRFASTRPVADWPRSSRPLELVRDAQGNPLLDAEGHPVCAWNHVAVVVDQAAGTTSFYVNGEPAGTSNSSLVVNNSGPLFLGEDGAAGPNHFRGLIDEVRLWNVPRSSVEVGLYAFTPLLGTSPSGLIGYWTFNEGTGTVLADRSGGGHNGVLVNVGLSNWQEGTDWGLPPLPSGIGGLNPNPAAAGLWVGSVVLNKVNEVQMATQGAAEIVTETARPATIRLLLHVATDGQVRLLKDVIVMKRPTATNAPPNVSTNPLPPVDLSTPATNLVLVTQAELIPNFEGVMKRGGKLVGLRYGTAAYDFDGVVLPLLGGVGPGASCLGRINLSKDHPTNPYRHKYHPDHHSGFEIVRQFTLLFNGEPGDPWQEAPGYGADRLSGIYRETVVGLHKIPLRVEGAVQLDRINTVNVLDDGH